MLRNTPSSVQDSLNFFSLTLFFCCSTVAHTLLGLPSWSVPFIIWLHIVCQGRTNGSRGHKNVLGAFQDHYLSFDIFESSLFSVISVETFRTVWGISAPCRSQAFSHVAHRETELWCGIASNCVFLRIVNICNLFVTSEK